MNSIFLLIYLTITQGGEIGMQAVDQYFPSLDKCHEYMDNEFLQGNDKLPFNEVARTHNFYHSHYRILVKDDEQGYMRVYMSCVEKPETPCGYFWPCGEIEVPTPEDDIRG